MVNTREIKGGISKVGMSDKMKGGGVPRKESSNGQSTRMSNLLLGHPGFSRNQESALTIASFDVVDPKIIQSQLKICHGL